MSKHGLATHPLTNSHFKHVSAWCDALGRITDQRIDKRFITNKFYIIITERNRALFAIICSKASAAFSNGYCSIIARIPVSAQNFSVSSESMAVPDGQPLIERLRLI